MGEDARAYIDLAARRAAVRSCLVRQFLRRSSAAIENVNLGSALLESEHCGTRRATSAQDQNFRFLQGYPLLEWTHHPGRVGVESIKLSILRPDHRIARADF